MPTLSSKQFGEELAEKMVSAPDSPLVQTAGGVDAQRLAELLLQPMGAANLAWATSAFGSDPTTYDSFAESFSSALARLLGEKRGNTPTE